MALRLCAMHRTYTAPCVYTAVILAWVGWRVGGAFCALHVLQNASIRTRKHTPDCPVVADAGRARGLLLRARVKTVPSSYLVLADCICRGHV